MTLATVTLPNNRFSEGVLANAWDTRVTRIVRTNVSATAWTVMPRRSFRRALFNGALRITTNGDRRIGVPSQRGLSGKYLAQQSDSTDHSGSKVPCPHLRFGGVVAACKFLVLVGTVAVKVPKVMHQRRMTSQESRCFLD